MSQLSDIARIGLRNLTRHSRRTLLTGTMVALAVAALTFFRGYIACLQDMMVDMVVNVFTSQAQVEPKGAGTAVGVPSLELDLPQALQPSLETVPGVEAVTPRVRFGAFLVNGEKSSLVVVQGVDPAGEQRVCPRGPGAGFSEGPAEAADHGVEGRGLADLDDDTILVGAALAKGLGIGLGDQVSLLARTQKGSTDAMDGVARGLIHTGDPELNKRLVIMSLRRAQKLLHMPGRVTSFQLAGPDRDQIPAMVSALKAKVGEQADVRSWKEIAPYYRDVVVLQNKIMRLVMGLVLILVLAGIVNTMMMSVFERQREVGTLMAMGFRRRSILALFLVEALGLGVLSAVVGAALGVSVVLVTGHFGIPFNVPAVGTITAHPFVDTPYTLSAMLGAVLTAVLAGLYPAHRASRLQPIEALRAI